MIENNDLILEEKRLKALRREVKKSKRKYAPRGGTMAGQAKRAEMSKFYIRSKRKPKIVIVDKTKK
ncbi:MAG: hypothetical protein AB1465_01940 [Patescibacteria group bacterium]